MHTQRGAFHSPDVLCYLWCRGKPERLHRRSSAATALRQPALMPVAQSINNYSHLRSDHVFLLQACCQCICSLLLHLPKESLLYFVLMLLLPGVSHDVRSDRQILQMSAQGNTPSMNPLLWCGLKDFTFMLDSFQIFDCPHLHGWLSCSLTYNALRYAVIVLTTPMNHYTRVRLVLIE